MTKEEKVFGGVMTFIVVSLCIGMGYFAFTTIATTIATKVLAIVLMTLSCIGLIVFVWHEAIHLRNNEKEKVK